MRRMIFWISVGLVILSGYMYYTTQTTFWLLQTIFWISMSMVDYASLSSRRGRRR